MLGGWYWGYLLAAATFQFVYPMFDGDLAWRAMFWMAIVPALFTLWIRARVTESPVWLDRQRQLAAARREGRPISEPRISLLRLFHLDLLGTTIQTTIVIGAFMCIYYSVSFWYPTFIREAGRETLPYLAAFNVGAIAGTATWGRLSETRLGRRGAVTITVILGVLSLPFSLDATETVTLIVGALMLGFFGMGVWGMAPAYTVERFPAEVRGAGPGFCYHAGAAIGAVMPWLLGRFQGRGVDLVTAMTVSMLVSGIFALAAIWSGPETRGRQFTA
jgi:MFS family permease